MAGGASACKWVDASPQCLLLVTLFHHISFPQAACDTAFAYAHERKQFNTKIGWYRFNQFSITDFELNAAGEFQLIQAKMAEMYANLSAVRWDCSHNINVCVPSIN